MLSEFDPRRCPRYQCRESTAQTIRQNLGGSIFDSNIIDLVVASLPLRSGLTVELPFFIYERGGVVPMTVAGGARSVGDFGTLGQRDA